MSSLLKNSVIGVVFAAGSAFAVTTVNAQTSSSEQQNTSGMTITRRDMRKDTLGAANKAMQYEQLLPGKPIVLLVNDDSGRLADKLVAAIQTKNDDVRYKGLNLNVINAASDSGANYVMLQAKKGEGSTFIRFPEGQYNQANFLARLLDMKNEIQGPTTAAEIIAATKNINIPVTPAKDANDGRKQVKALAKDNLIGVAVHGGNEAFLYAVKKYLADLKTTHPEFAGLEFAIVQSGADPNAKTGDVFLFGKTAKKGSAEMENTFANDGNVGKSIGESLDYIVGTLKLQAGAKASLLVEKDGQYTIYTL